MSRRNESASNHYLLNELCPICDDSKLVPHVRTSNIQTALCDNCGHRTALHRLSVLPAEYHDQYLGDIFLDTLRATRVRQARAILRQIRRCAPTATRLLDYGCGRGWFIQTARSDGFDVLGADTSELAVRLLRETGIHGVQLSGYAPIDTSSLPFQPQVISILDVAEHFPPPEVANLLKNIASLFSPTLKLLAIKVPVSNGLMYRAATVLSRLGKGEFLDRLYQVGTDPPHLNYFSVRSAQLAVEKAGFDIIDSLKDCDYEPDSLVTRAQIGSKLPAFIGRFAGHFAVNVTKALDIEDSIILFAKPRLTHL